MAQRIDVKDLNIFYGDFRAVADVEMAVEPRSVTAFIGPSGCGKSTFLRTLNRMHEVIPGAHVQGSVAMDGVDLYGVRHRPGRGAPPGRHGVPAPQPVPDDVDRGERAGRHQAEQQAHLQGRRRRTSSRPSLRGANLWNEVKDRLNRPGSGPLGRPAAAAVHRARHRGQAAGAAHGRAVLGAGPDLDARHRGPHRRAEVRLHDRHRHAQHAAGRARLGPDGVLQPRRDRASRAGWSRSTTRRRSSPRRACRPRRTTSRAASAEPRTQKGPSDPDGPFCASWSVLGGGGGHLRGVLGQGAVEHGHLRRRSSRPRAWRRSRATRPPGGASTAANVTSAYPSSSASLTPEEHRLLRAQLDGRLLVADRERDRAVLVAVVDQPALERPGVALGRDEHVEVAAAHVAERERGRRRTPSTRPRVVIGLVAEQPASASPATATPTTRAAARRVRGRGEVTVTPRDVGRCGLGWSTELSVGPQPSRRARLRRACRTRDRLGPRGGGVLPVTCR